MHLLISTRFVRRIGWFTAALALAAALGLPADAAAQTCARTLTAEVVAFDQVFFWNRLGAVQPQGMMYALKRDVVPISGTVLSPGNVKLRSDKRPRPIVLRMNVGDCLRIEFQNFLASTRRDQDQSATRWASIHVVGLQWNLINLDDGSYVGRNPNGLANIAQKLIYQLYAEREGEHVLRSMGAPAGGEGDGGQVNAGLFGAVIVEPAGSRWYRSQIDEAGARLRHHGLHRHRPAHPQLRGALPGGPSPRRHAGPQHAAEQPDHAQRSDGDDRRPAEQL